VNILLRSPNKLCKKQKNQNKKFFKLLKKENSAQTMTTIARSKTVKTHSY
jgi:hypothetical protein